MDADTLAQDVALLAARLLELQVPDECLAGVAANLAALAEHAGRVSGETTA